MKSSCQLLKDDEIRVAGENHHLTRNTGNFLTVALSHIQTLAISGGSERQRHYRNIF